MIIMGESTYPHCASMRQHPQVPDLTVACPFQGIPRLDWCRACLLSEIRRLECELHAVSERAMRAVKG